MNIKQKLTSAAVIGAMMAGVVAPASFAATTVNVRNNGALSTNLTGVIKLSKKSVKQKNSTVAVTSVKSKSNTGKNTSSFNTGGSNSITTGNARNNVVVVVNGGTNTNTDAECECVDPTTDVTISGNGAMSTNGVLVVSANSNSVYQSNSSVVVTSVNTSSNTGGNNSSFNTNGGGSTGTGAATNNVGVEVGGSANIN